MRRLLLSQYMRSVSQGEPGATVLAASTNPIPPHLHRSKGNLRNSTTKKQDAEREIRNTHRKDLQRKKYIENRTVKHGD